MIPGSSSHQGLIVPYFVVTNGNLNLSYIHSQSIQLFSHKEL